MTRERETILMIMRTRSDKKEVKNRISPRLQKNDVREKKEI